MTVKGNITLDVALAFAFGIVFIVTLLFLANGFPNPTPFQYNVFRIVLAIAMAGVASVIPGIIQVQIPGIRSDTPLVRAGGALAVFVVVYFYSPAGMTGVKVQTNQEAELSTLIVPVKEGFTNTEDLVVTKSDAFLNNGLLEKRFNHVVIKDVAAQMPIDSTLVANEISGEGGASLTGSSFSVVSRKLSNLTIDVSAKTQENRQIEAGSTFLYVKQIANSRVLARGEPGIKGLNGTDGLRGENGKDGTNGKCGASIPGVMDNFRGSTDGGNGANGTDGGDGTNGTPGTSGGKVVVTTIMEPLSLTSDVKGGEGGQGGKGGHGGTGGQGGKGGASCFGAGGDQPTRPSGKPGSDGKDGKDGSSAPNGKNGDYQSIVKESFDNIIAIIGKYPNKQLHERLQK
jgi:hypothetical protein